MTPTDVSKTAFVSAVIATTGAEHHLGMWCRKVGGVDVLDVAERFSDRRVDSTGRVIGPQRLVTEY